jgi:hypothetical protein
MLPFVASGAEVVPHFKKWEEPMFKSKRSRILLIATVFLVGLLFGATSYSPTDAFAVTNATYYSNGSYNTVVGQFGVDCCNNPVAWGTKTKWVIYGGCFVCFPPPR